MIIAADSTPCLCLGLFFVRAVSGKPISTVASRNSSAPSDKVNKDNIGI